MAGDGRASFGDKHIFYRCQIDDFSGQIVGIIGT